MQQYRYKKSNFDELQKNETTSRAGKGWETGEEDKLLSMRLNKSSYDEIALELKRTVRSIQTRLYLYICKSVETENEDENVLIGRYDVDYDDFVSFKTQRQESSQKSYRKPYRKSSKFDTTANGANSQYITPYENKNYNVKSEINFLRQEVFELRKLISAK